MSKALGRIVLGLTALALIAFSRLAGAQANVTPDTAERRHALEIYSAGRYVDAMPLLENLVAEYPSDVQIREAWAFSIFAYSTSLSDPETRRKARIRARSVAVQAQKLGDKSPIVQMMLAIAEDGSEPSFSNRKDVDAATKDGDRILHQRMLPERPALDDQDEFGDGQTMSGSCGDISHMHFTTHGRRNCAPWETCPLRSTGREEPAAVGERQFMCSREERHRVPRRTISTAANYVQFPCLQSLRANILSPLFSAPIRS